MKKLVALVCTLLLVLTTVSAVAEGAWNWEEEALKGLPISNEMITLTVMGSKYYLGSSDVSEYEEIAWLREHANVDITGELISEDVWLDKLALAVAADNLPDLIIRSNLTGSLVTEYGTKAQALLPLNDLIDEYAPNIKALFEGYPYVKALCTAADGNIYVLPKINMLPRDQHARYWMNEAWLKALDLGRPQTLDELYNVLVAFRDRDPNGNGAKDEIAVTGNNGKSIDGLILNAYGFNVADSTNYYDERDGKVIFIPQEEGYKEYLKYMHKLYSEGLLDNEMFIQNEQQMNAKGAELKLGTFCSAASFITVPGEEGLKYTQIGPFTSELNDTPFVPVNGGINTFATAITTANEHPVETIKLLDWFFGRAGSVMAEDGPYGCWTWRDETKGTWDYVIPDGYDGVEAFRTGKATIHNGFCSNLPIDFSLGAYTADSSGVDLAGWMNQQTADYYEPYFRFNFPSLTLTEDELKIVKPIETDLNLYVEGARAQFITGELDIDNNWDSYVQNIQSMRVESMLEQYQHAYDRYVSAMK